MAGEQTRTQQLSKAENCFCHHCCCFHLHTHSWTDLRVFKSFYRYKAKCLTHIFPYLDCVMTQKLSTALR